MKTKIAASILTADFGNLRQNLEELEKTSVNIIHFDVMDGHFVPNITFGPALIQSLRPAFQSIFDIHLMIVEPEKYLDKFIQVGANWLSFHWEVVQEDQARRICQKLRKHNIKAGIAISPETEVQSILPILNEIDFVVVMTVQPGFGGQDIIPECFSKIELLKKIFLQKNLAIQIEIDGGVKKENIAKLVKIGADVLIAGSAIFNPQYTVQQAVKNLVSVL